MTPDEVLGFWFEGDPALFRDKWFKADATFDATCRETFGAALDAAQAGAFDSWTATPRGTLALVILLDQFSRNIHRGTPAAFAADPKARQIAASAVERGDDRTLEPLERSFLYLPFEHSEDLADQHRSVELFEGLRGAYESADRAIEYAERHRDVIHRFGRFPHRNALLGRESTKDELAYLAEPGGGF